MRLSDLLLALLLLLLRLFRFPLGLRRGLACFGLLASLRLPRFGLLARLGLLGLLGLPCLGLLASLGLPGLPRFCLLGPARFGFALLPLPGCLALGLGGLGALLRRIGLRLVAPGLLFALPRFLPRLLLTLERFALFAGLTLRPGALFLLATRRLRGLVLLRPLRRGRGRSRGTFIAALLRGGLLLLPALSRGALLFAALFGQPGGGGRCRGFAAYR